MAMQKKSNEILDKTKKAYPEKSVSEEKIFSHIHRGDRISGPLHGIAQI